MAHIKWRDQMSLDGEVIDQDHKHLIDIINRFVDMSTNVQDKDQILEVLFSLKFYARTHFEREENLQKLVVYPFASAHAREHADLVKQLDHVTEAINESQGEGLAEISRETANLLHSWLVDHIIKSDLRMKPYVKKMKAHTKNIGRLEDIEPV